MNYLIVFLGGGLGAALRHGINLIGVKVINSSAPIQTLLINIIGCLLMGLIAGFFAFRGHLPQHFRLFFMTGFLGGFTTFSAFSLEVALMIEREQYFFASLYSLLTIMISIGATFIGLNIMKILFG